MLLQLVLFACTLPLLVSTANITNWINVAVMVAKDAPIGLIPAPVHDPFVGERSYDLTQTNLIRGFAGFQQDLIAAGGVPIINTNQSVGINMLYFNIGIDLHFQAANETAFANAIAAGEYGVIPVILVHYMVPAYRTACSTSQNCTAISTLLSDVTLFQCTVSSTTGQLPSDCISNKVKSGGRRSEWVVSALQDSTTLGLNWIDNMRIHQVTSMMIFSDAATALTIAPPLIAQASQSSIASFGPFTWPSASPPDYTAMHTFVSTTLASVSPLPQTLVIIATGVEYQYADDIMDILKELNVNFQSVLIIDGAHATMTIPETNYICATAPWVPIIRGPNYNGVSTPNNLYVYPSNGTNQMAQTFVNVYQPRYPTMPLSYYPVMVIGVGACILIQKSIEYVGVTNPTADQLRDAMNKINTPSPNGIIELDNIGRFASNERIVFQIQPDGSFLYLSPSAIASPNYIFPNPTWDQQLNIVTWSFNGLIVLLQFGLAGICAWAVWLTSESLLAVLYDERHIDVDQWSTERVVWSLATVMSMTLLINTNVLAIPSVIFLNLFPKQDAVFYNRLDLFLPIFIGLMSSFATLHVVVSTVQWRQLRKAGEASATESAPTHTPPMEPPSKKYQLETVQTTGLSFQCVQTVGYTQFKFALASLIFTLGMLLMFILSWYSIRASVTQTMAIGPMVGVFVGSWVLAHLGLVMLFYVSSAWKLLAMIFLPGSSMVMSYCGLLSTWYQHAPITTVQGVQDILIDTALLGGVVMPAVAAFLLVGLVIWWLKGSRLAMAETLKRERHVSNQALAQRDQQIASLIRDAAVQQKEVVWLTSVINGVTLLQPRLDREIGSEHPFLQDCQRQYAPTAVNLELPLPNSTAIQTPSIPDASTDEILSNPVALEMVKQQAMSNDSIETIMFYLDVLYFESIDDARSQLLMMDHIYGIYLKEQAPRLVNFGFDELNSIRAICQRKAVNRKMFAALRSEARQVIATNDIHRIVQNAQAKLAINRIVHTFKEARHSRAASGAAGPTLATGQFAPFAFHTRPFDRTTPSMNGTSKHADTTGPSMIHVPIDSKVM